MVLPRPVALSPELLASVMRWAGLGEPHAVLAGEPRWRPAAEAGAWERRARERAAALGLLDRRGEVDVEVAASLAVLCRASTEYYGWVAHAGRTTGVLAGAVGGDGVLAVSDGESVRLRKANAKRLPEALARQTADVPPGRGPSVRARRPAAPRAGRAPDLAVLERSVPAPAVGGGELYAAVRDRVGRRAESPRPLRFTDTPHGRWAHAAVPLPGGDELLELAPAGRAELAARLHRMRERLLRDW